MRFHVPAIALFSFLASAAAASATERIVTLQVSNMSCVACPYIVEQALAGVPGVVQVKVSFESRTAIVKYDDSQADVSALTMATKQAGYPSQPQTASGE